MKNELPLVEVFILSYNRPEYILQTIDSVIQQNYPNMQITVSDNSSTDAVFEKIQGYPGKAQIRYIRRTPTLPALSHFNTIFSEARAEYFIVFHDDDLMLPDAVAKLVTEICRNTHFSAVAGNAFLLEEQTLTKKLFNPNLKTGKEISSTEDLVVHYLESERGHAPFPCYIYRKSKIENLKMIFKEGQKHSDVTFLVKVCKRGPIYWLAEPVMYYRKHSSNDSLNIDLVALFSLCRFLRKNVKISLEQITLFKMKTILLWMKQRNSKTFSTMSPWKDRILVRASLHYAFSHPKAFIPLLLKRLHNKLNSVLQSPNDPA
jgi:glycosyltransferase involved in cell wall biosynthesis